MGCGASTQTKYEEATAAALAEAAKKEKRADDDEEDEDEDDVMDDAEFEKNMAKAQTKGARMGVSAERTEVDKNWKPPVFEKTGEQEARLRQSLGKCFMFSVLDEAQLKAVVNAFQEMPAIAGQTVIEQGAAVTATEPALYVIESGELNVFKTGIEKSVFTYTIPGQYFGDLALLYNAPRAATVKANSDSSLWSIDRDTFNNLVKDAARQQMEKRLGFLAEVPCLKGLKDDERMSICDAMQVRNFEAGDAIIKRGDFGKDFCLVEFGRAEARIEGNVVMSYETTNFFGELALLKDAPRAADVVASEPCRLLVLGAESFRRLLGPLDAILQERAEAYANVDIEKFKAS